MCNVGLEKEAQHSVSSYECLKVRQEQLDKTRLCVMQNQPSGIMSALFKAHIK